MQSTGVRHPTLCLCGTESFPCTLSKGKKYAPCSFVCAVQAEEAKHWLVLPGTSLWHLGTPPNAACAQSVVLENVRYWDTGHVMGLGHVTVAPPCAPVPLQVMVDNAPLPIPGPVAGPAPVMANVHDPPSAGARWRFNFSFPSAGLLAGSQQRRVRAMATRAPQRVLRLDWEPEGQER